MMDHYIIVENGCITSIWEILSIVAAEYVAMSRCAQHMQRVYHHRSLQGDSYGAIALTNTRTISSIEQSRRLNLSLVTTTIAYSHGGDDHISTTRPWEMEYSCY
jgi:hypothetical protein